MSQSLLVPTQKATELSIQMFDLYLRGYGRSWLWPLLRAAIVHELKIPQGRMVIEILGYHNLLIA